jgi:hypothetical protein
MNHDSLKTKRTLMRTWTWIPLAAATLLGCKEPTTQPTTPPVAAQVDHSLHGAVASGPITAANAPFTQRGVVNPITIREPDFDMSLRAGREMTVQRVVFPPGPTIWHTHPATSFVLVVSGSVRLERVLPERGGNICALTPIFNPNQTFVEAPNRVHRAIVQGTQDAELLVVRFNVPVGTPLTVQAPDPTC